MNAKRILRGRDALAYIVRYLNLGQVIKDGNELMLDDALNFFRGLLDECQKAEAELNEARSTIVLREKSNDCIQEALDIARAELVQAKKDYDWMMAQHDVWKACAFKEAELKSGFKAELDALKPLLDALMDKKMAMDWDCDEFEDRIVLVCNGQDFLRAALAYRERKGEK